MKINTKIPIDLETFVKTGKFDVLKMGMTKHEVLAVFPEPEDWSSTKNYLESNIWKYGNFELHFEDDSLLMLINDYIATIDGGKSLDFKRWIFESKNNRTLIKIMQAFNRERMNFEKTSDSIGNVMLRIMESDVYLAFYPEYSLEEEANKNADMNDFKVDAIYKIDSERKSKDD